MLSRITTWIEKNFPSAPPTASPYSVVNGSRVLTLFFGDPRWKKVWLKVFIFFLLTTGLCILGCWLSDTSCLWTADLKNGKRVVGIFDDIGMLMKNISYFLAIVIANSFLRKIPITLMGSDHGLEKSIGLPQVTDFSNDYEPAYLFLINQNLDTIKAKNQFGKAGQGLVRLVFMIFFCVTYGSFLLEPRDMWCQSPWEFPLGFCAVLFQDAIIYNVIAPLIVWRILGTVYSINVILKELTLNHRIRLNPFSTGQAGGLNLLGELALNMTYILAALIPFLIAATWTMGEHFVMRLIWPLYALLLSGVFFLSFGAANKAMRKIKEENLNKIMQIINSLYNQFTRLSRDSEDTNEERVGIAGKLHSVRMIYDQATKMPVWPYDFQTLRKFVTIVMWPIIIFLLDMFTKVPEILKNAESLRMYIKGALKFLFT
jgi:hypothetical protein